MTDSSILRTLFNSTAREYDSIRPTYPEALIEDVISLSGIPVGGRILEIGCGTGQATLPFAQKGYSMLCLDIGPDMLAIAVENLRAYPRVRFEQVAFEDWPAQDASFDLIISATAFHWVPPEVGYPKSARVLKPGGALAIFTNMHPRPVSGFFAEVQPIYERFFPPQLGAPDLTPTDLAIRAAAGKIDSTALFSPVTVRTYSWSRTYTTHEYLRLLNTYSHHLSLPEAARAGLFQAIAGLIEQRYGGQVERPYLSVLYLARTPVGISA